MMGLYYLDVFPKENRNTEGNLLLCPVIIIVDSLRFILFCVQIQRSHAPNRKSATYFLWLFITPEALVPWFLGQCVETSLPWRAWVGAVPGGLLKLCSHIIPQPTHGRERHKNVNFTKQLKGCNQIQLTSLLLYLYIVVGHVCTGTKLKKKLNQQYLTKSTWWASQPFSTHPRPAVCITPVHSVERQLDCIASSYPRLT